MGAAARRAPRAREAGRRSALWRDGVAPPRLQYDGGGGVEVFQIDPLVDGMDVAHAAGEIGDLDAPSRVDVRIRAATRGPRAESLAEALGRLRHQRHHLGGVGHVEPLVLAVHLHLDAGPVLSLLQPPPAAGPRLLEAPAPGLRLRLELLDAEAARLPVDHYPRGHDVGGETALDASEVGRGLGVHAAELHPCDGLTDDLDGGEPTLRADTRVR